MEKKILNPDSELEKIFDSYSVDENNRFKYLYEDVAQQHVAKLLLSLWEKDRCCLVVGAGRGALSCNLGLAGLVVNSVEPYEPYRKIIEWKYRRYGINGLVCGGVIEEVVLTETVYDYAAMVDVIEHVESPSLALRNIFSSLKPGGELYITVPARYQLVDPHYKIAFLCWMPLRLADKLLELTGKLKDDGENGRQRLSSMHYFTYGKFNRLAKVVGFDTVDLRLLQIESPDKFTFSGDRFSRLSLGFKRFGLSWLLKLLSRHFLGHRLILRKPLR